MRGCNDPPTSGSTAFHCLRSWIASLVTAPHPLERLWQRLFAHFPVAVTGVERVAVLVLVTLVLEHLRHAVVSHHPVMHVVAHDIRVVEITVADVHPDADGFAFGLRDDAVVIVPGAAG